MVFDKEMKFKVGDRLVIHSGKTVVVQKVDAKHGEYHVINADDDEDFEIIKEREVVVNLGGYDNVVQLAVNENIEAANEAEVEEEITETVAEPETDDDDDEDEEEVARLKALYNQLEEDAQRNAEEAKRIVEDAEKQAGLIAEVVAADEELLRAEKEVAEAEAAIAELELAIADPDIPVEEAMASLEKEMAEAEEAVAVLGESEEETVAETEPEETVAETEEETVAEEKTETEVAEAEPEVAVAEAEEPAAEIEIIIEPEADPMQALRELYDSMPQVECVPLPTISLQDDSLLRYSGWKEKLSAYGKGRRKRGRMKAWKQS